MEYAQIREIAALSAQAGAFALAFGVLDGFKTTSLYKDASNFHPHINQRLIKSLSNQDFLRYFEATEDPDARYYLKDEFIHRFGDKFLDYVLKGNEVAIIAMLNRCPELLSYRGYVSLSDGYLTKVSGLELEYYIHNENTGPIINAILNQSYDITVEAIQKPLGNALLHYTIRGNQDDVVKILNRYPALLAYRGNVVDYSGRQFKNVTALELAVWAWDVRHMAPAMLKCLTDNALGIDFTEELAAELNNQYNAVTGDGGGVTYIIECGLLRSSRDPSLLPEWERDSIFNELLHRRNGLIQHDDKLFYFNNLSYPKMLTPITDPTQLEALKALFNKKDITATALMHKKDITMHTDRVEMINQKDDLLIIQNNITGTHHIIKESSYKFNQLVDALERYPDDSSSIDAHLSHWKNVLGLAQFYIPAHVAHHYCDRNVGFKPTPQFKEDTLARRLEIHQDQENSGWNDRYTGKWWKTNYDEGNTLGIKFGLIRNNYTFAHSACTLACFASDREPDLKAIKALHHARKADLIELKRQLGSLQRPNACCTIQ